jgi:hypothetical protein
MAALFGDVPFQEANQGNTNLNPVYDTQADVYQGLVDTLTAAIGNIEAGGIGPGDLDIHFGGDADAWLEVAYTLLARYELHRGNYGAALTAAENGIASAENNLIGPHDGVRDVNMNPYFEFVELDRAGYLTAANAHARIRLSDRENAKTDEDARLSFYYTEVDGDNFLNTSSEGAFGASSDMMLVTYVENELIKAEAELLENDDAGAAVAALNNARDANQAFYGGAYAAYDLSDFDTGGIANNGGSLEASLLEEILEEKYLSTIGNIEGFTDIRRTGNYIGVPATSGDNLPNRFLYPQVEVTANANVPTPIPGTFTPTSLFDANSESYAGYGL